MCKLHLLVRDKRAEKNRAWEDAYARDRAINEVATELSEKLGFQVGAEYNCFTGHYTGRFVVPEEWLTEVADNEA